MLIFISGSSTSGKSSLAEAKLSTLAKDSPKIYIATSRINNSDPEMLRRIQNHKLMRRDKNFTTIEKSEDINEILNQIPENSAVLLESLSNLAANEMFRENRVISPEIVFAKIWRDIANLRDKAKILLIVSDDIFSDGIAYGELTMKYIKLLGRLHVKIASESDENCEIFSGIIINYERTIKFE